MRANTVDVLQVEDNLADALLTQTAFAECGVHMNVQVVPEGDAALRFLRRCGEYQAAPRPDLILLDMNLPGRSGAEILAEIKGDGDLRSSPVVIFSSSDAPADLLRAYDAHASCYLKKPLDLDQFITAIKSLEEFWFRRATLLGCNR